MNSDGARGATGRPGRWGRLALVAGSGGLACAVGALLGRGDDDHALAGVAGGLLALVIWVFVGLFLAVVSGMLRRNGRSLPRATALVWSSACAGIVGLSLSWGPKSWWLEHQFAQAFEWAEAQVAKLDEQCRAGQRPLELDLSEAPAWADEGSFTYSLSPRSYSLALRAPSGEWTIWKHGEAVHVSHWKP